MNPAWVKGASETIGRLQRDVNALRARCEKNEAAASALAERGVALLERIEALEAKRGPGRPPKGKAE